MDVWKENILKDLKAGLLEYEIVGEFLMDIRKEFRERDEKSTKIAELKRLEQGRKMMEEFVQELKRAARRSGYEERFLIEKFKRGINRMIRKKLIEAERPPISIEQWYEQATNLDRHWRESKKKEKRLRR